MPKGLFWVVSMLSLGAASMHLPAAAEDAYPTRPVTLVIPYAPGGSADVMARVLAQKLSEELKQSVVVDVKSGAGGIIGAQLVSRARPDGYTVLLGANPLAISAALMKLPFDAQKDLVPVAGLLGLPSVLVTRADSPYRNSADIVRLSKGTPLSFGSSGQGTHSHMSGELFAVLSGAQLVHVPYKGSGAVYPDLIAGRVELLFDAAASAIGQIKSGRVKAVGVTSRVRSNALPDVPTLLEQGVKGYENLTWFGLFAPTGTPAGVVGKLNAAVNKVVASSEFNTYMDQWGALRLNDVRTPEELGNLLKEDTERWSNLVKEGRVKRLD